MVDYEGENSSTTLSEDIFVDRGMVPGRSVEAADGDVRPDFMGFLVSPVPYEYKLKRYQARKGAHDTIVFEIDDSHRFRNSVSLMKNTASTLQSLSGGRTSTMREYLKARSFESEMRAQYERLVRPAPGEEVRYPADVVEWEKEVEELVATADEEKEWEGEPKVDNEGEVLDYDDIDRLLDEKWEEAPDNDGWVDAEVRGAGEGKWTNDNVNVNEGTNNKLGNVGNNTSNNSNLSIVPATRRNNGPLAYEAASHVQTKEYINNLLADGWEENVIYDEETLTRNRLSLYVDDPNLIFERVEEKKRGKSKRKGQGGERMARSRYNISNDRYYLTEGRRVSLGTFGVQHCAVALRLDERFYRANLTKEELKNFHRPPLRLGSTEYRMALGSVKMESSRSRLELSLGEAAAFRVIEYAEDEPPFIVNHGMVSLLTRYYRTSDAGDEQCPTGCVTLETGEDAPFFGYGDVAPGTVVETLGNNLFIAPVAAHRLSGTYLCAIEGGRAVVRPLDSVLLAGQELPKEEVYAPHSRRLNQFCKDRLKAAAHRAFARGDHLLMSDLDQMFPYFSEGSKRKWLKEYADCVKRGRDNVWILRDPGSVLCEEDIRKLVAPEGMCQYESMLAGELRMQELGLRCTEDGEDDNGRYTPNWILTRNFLNAANGRGLLQLAARRTRSKQEGEDADSVFLSFRRVRFRKGNEAENRKILAEHQASYKERIDRIWARQLEFLAATKPPEFTARKHEEQEEKKARKIEEMSKTEEQESNSQAAMPALLTITRTYEENGQIVRRTETLHDQRLVKAYLKARRRLSDDRKGALTCSSCGQPGHMKTNKSCPKYVTAVRPSKKKFETEKKRARAVFQDLMHKLLTKFNAIPFSNAFHRPVSARKFPNYPLLVKNPIDFSTIRAKVRSGAYLRFTDFVAEFKLMLDNCILYNGPTHSLTEIAENIYQQALAYADEHASVIEEAEETFFGED